MLYKDYHYNIQEYSYLVFLCSTIELNSVFQPQTIVFYISQCVLNKYFVQHTKTNGVIQETNREWDTLVNTAFQK